MLTITLPEHSAKRSVSIDIRRAPHASRSERSRRGTLFGVALNYQGLLHSRLEEFQQPPYQKPPVKPVLFIKTPNTRNGNGDPVVFPPPSSACNRARRWAW
jgi:2-keto-4-pentenoate hydratase/2-oxohepta-3-ene-1,7-dioic acid hydratase in catechol pathway